jgi:hypothetical protein
MTEVLSIGPWRTNAELIAYGVVPLGYIDESEPVLDCTYGLGKFWTLYCPPTFVGTDANADFSPWGHAVDFRYLYETFAPDTFGTVVFDPPYKLNGTSTGKGPSALDRLYGVDGRYVAWQTKHRIIRDGILGALSVLRPKGWLLLKCMDQVSSGAVRWQTREFSDYAEAQGCRLVDMLHLPTKPRKQLGDQVHSRRNYSTLLVLRRR